MVGVVGSSPIAPTKICRLKGLCVRDFKVLKVWSLAVRGVDEGPE